MAKIFKLQPNPTFKAKVSIPVPGEDAAELTLIFKHKSKKALADFYDNLSPVKPTFDDAGNVTNQKEIDEAARSDVDSVAELLAGWEGVDADYNREALETLLDNYPGAALAILIGYRRSLMEAQVGNSPR